MPNRSFHARFVTGSEWKNWSSAFAAGQIAGLVFEAPESIVGKCFPPDKSGTENSHRRIFHSCAPLLFYDLHPGNFFHYNTEKKFSKLFRKFFRDKDFYFYSITLFRNSGNRFMRLPEFSFFSPDPPISSISGSLCCKSASSNGPEAARKPHHNCFHADPLRSCAELCRCT